MRNESFVKYLNAGSLDREWGLYLTVAGKAKIPPALLYPPKVHPSSYFFTWEKGRILQEYQINYITEGSGIFETATDQFVVEPGSVLILRPGMWHRYQPDPTTGWNEHYVGFKGDFCDNIFHEGFFQLKRPVLYVGFREPLLKLFLEIIQLVKEEKTGHQQMGAANVVLLLSSILSVTRNHEFAGKSIEHTIRKAWQTQCRLFLFPPDVPEIYGDFPHSVPSVAQDSKSKRSVGLDREKFQRNCHRSRI
jgi:hypothetical protein